jgi:hypothetical protein
MTNRPFFSFSPIAFVETSRLLSALTHERDLLRGNMGNDLCMLCPDREVNPLYKIILERLQRKKWIDNGP